MTASRSDMPHRADHERSWPPRCRFVEQLLRGSADLNLGLCAVNLIAFRSTAASSCIGIDKLARASLR